MRKFSPDQTGIDLSVPLLKGEDIIWFGFSGILVVCAGLVCLNFRARLLSRNTWKGEHQHQQQKYEQKTLSYVKPKWHSQRQRRSNQSTTRPLPVPNPISSACSLSNVDTHEDFGDILHSPQITRCANGGHLSNKMTTIGLGSPFESRVLETNNFRYNVISPCQTDRSTGNSPCTSETSRVKRIFHIPNWASKLVQYLRLPLLKTQSYPLNEVTLLQPSTADTSSSGCSSGSSADSHTSTTITGASSRPNGYDRIGGGWSSWCLSPSHLLRKKHFEGVLCSELQTAKIPVDSDCSGVIQSSSYADDLASLESEAELIDPVYSKIRSPSFADPVPSDYDSVIDSDEWSFPPNVHRGSFVSATSEDADHASTHIYHQLVKRDKKPVDVPSPQSCSISGTQISAKTPALPESIPNPPVDRNSAGSFRLPRPSPLRRVIDCVVSFRSSESVTGICQNTAPPKLPDRTYGQSTVNLVYRLRTLLRYKEASPEQAPSFCGLSGSQHVKKAATLTVLTHGSSTDLLHPSVALSCTNVNCDETAMVGNMHPIYGKDSMQTAKRGIHETHTDQHYLSSGNISQQCYPSVTGINSLQYPECSIDSIRQEQTHFQQTWNPTLCLQKSHNGSQIHLRWSSLAGSYGNIRHIDSEVDLLNVRPNNERNSSNAYSILSPIPPSPLTSGSISLTGTESTSDRGEIKSFPDHDAPRPGLFSSPTKSVSAGVQNRTLMSPLMERSMEDDELRYTLGHQSCL